MNKKALQWNYLGAMILVVVAILVILILIGIFSGKMYEIIDMLPF